MQAEAWDTRESLPAYQRGEDLAERHPVPSKRARAARGVACAGSLVAPHPGPRGSGEGVRVRLRSGNAEASSGFRKKIQLEDRTTLPSVFERSGTQFLIRTHLEWPLKQTVEDEGHLGFP
jgi:hypothetical protein